MTKTLLEFFAGGGMARLGLGPEWTCLLANEIDPKKAASYIANFGPDRLRICDVAALTVADVPGHADLAWGSPPCQDLSEAGKGAGMSGARSGAAWPFLRLIKGLRAESRAPKIIVIENVTGWFDRHFADRIEVVELLMAVGYRVGVLVVDAALFLSQSRPRVFVVAVDEHLAIPNSLILPMCDLASPSRRIMKVYERLPTAVRAKWIWWRLPPPPARNVSFSNLLRRDEGWDVLSAHPQRTRRPARGDLLRWARRRAARRLDWRFKHSVCSRRQRRRCSEAPRRSEPTPSASRRFPTRSSWRCSTPDYQPVQRLFSRAVRSAIRRSNPTRTRHWADTRNT